MWSLKRTCEHTYNGSPSASQSSVPGQTRSSSSTHTYLACKHEKDRFQWVSGPAATSNGRMARKIEIDFGKEEALLSFDERKSRKGEFMILLKGGEEGKGK